MHSQQTIHSLFHCRAELLGPKRYTPLSLGELFDAGIRISNDQHFFHFYGMVPQLHYARGVRLLGRMAMEGCVDQQADPMARETLRIVRDVFPGEQPTVVDLFTGTGNLLYHVSRAVEAGSAIGFESDPAVYACTARNLALVDPSIELHRGASQDLLDPGMFKGDQPVIVLIDPPWGSAFDVERGLDLRLTEPPIREVLRMIDERLGHLRVIAVVKTFELIVEESLRALSEDFPFCSSGVTAGISPGSNVSYVICPLGRHAYLKQDLLARILRPACPVGK